MDDDGEEPLFTDLEQVRAEAAGCRRCDLWAPATQTVFGEGPAPASVMLVGEQPGDREDREGEPFVGPAGRVLDRALERAGIDRSQVYLTNAVKHFKFTERGKRRIHQKPNRAEVTACRVWFDAELALVRPEALVLLGATAARAVIGSKFSLMRERGRWITTATHPRVLATTHPSQVLRVPSEDREAAFDALVDDLAVVAAALPGVRRRA